MTTMTTTKRLEALEAEAFRAQRYQEQVTARLDHLTNAIGDLSQDGRSVAFDIREIKTSLTEIRTDHGARLERIESTLAGHDTRFDGIDTRFEGIESTLASHDARFEGIELTLTGHSELLHAILARLDGKPERTPTIEANEPERART